MSGTHPVLTKNVQFRMSAAQDANEGGGTYTSEVVDDEGHETVVDHRLHLCLVACSDV